MSLNNYDDLLQEIAALRLESKIQEEALSVAWTNFASSVNPVDIVKDTLHKLTHDNEIQSDITKVAMHAGSSLLIGKILGKNRSIQGYFTSVIVEKLYFTALASPLFKSIFNLKQKEKQPKNDD